ncbi:hypothetical protein EFR01_17570 [Sinorhizobium fredii]|nr:hypothetical protein EFR01_17570 [Sinorhizobium fredii]GLS11761.1 hypothetical protein GCM10007864_53930 [Sinorhizobium fredii]
MAKAVIGASASIRAIEILIIIVAPPEPEGTCLSGIEGMIVQDRFYAKLNRKRRAPCPAPYSAARLIRRAKVAVAF